MTEIGEVEMLEEEILCEEPVFFAVVWYDDVGPWRYC